jgi:hypothetical protein
MMPRRKGNESKVELSSNAARDGLVWNVGAESIPALRVPKGQVYTVKKTVDLGVLLTTATASPTAGEVNFTLSSLAEASSYEAIFDQYKIDMAELWIIPEAPTGGTAQNYQYASVLDYDDSNALSTLQVALNYDNAVVASLLTGMYRRLKPRIALAAYSGSFSSYANLRDQWLDCASPGVQHYGVKIVAEPGYNGLLVRGIARLTISFRASR